MVRPFANIVHGRNSLIATKTALKLADYVVTEAGFGADFGTEKFFNIKCCKGNLRPDTVVLVTTVRSIKMHGGMSKENLTSENIETVIKGSSNLVAHINNLKKFGVHVVAAINHFVTDTEGEIQAVKDIVSTEGVKQTLNRSW